jgi:hypothetical protein
MRAASFAVVVASFWMLCAAAPPVAQPGLRMLRKRVLKEHLSSTGQYAERQSNATIAVTGAQPCPRGQVCGGTYVGIVIGIILAFLLTIAIICCACGCRCRRREAGERGAGCIDVNDLKS